MQMITNADMLNFIRQNAEMGIDGIHTVMKQSTDKGLRETLGAQEEEYRRIFEEADNMLHERNEEPKDLNPMAKMGLMMSDAMKQMTTQTTSKIAEGMIKGSTMGVTKIIKHMDDYDGDDVAIIKLAERLKETEESNIEQMKKFL